MVSPPDRHDVPSPVPVLPEYGGACIANLVPALLRDGGNDRSEPWLPELVRQADQLVLLVVDGLGWEQLRARPGLAPTLHSAQGIDRPISSVAPTTTATALTSITTGRPPAEHGILGYRLSTGDEILNVLRWTVGTSPERDARRTYPARRFQCHPSFPDALGPVPVVSRHEFGGTGFTAAHLGNSPLHGYRVASSLPLEVGALLRGGERFVYAYYDGIDKVAHGSGLGALYEAELAAVDLLVAEVAAQLPAGAVLVVTADHGQVDVGPDVELLGREAMAMTEFLSGEGRFRWVHALPGRAADLTALLAERYGSSTWVRSREQLIDDGWFGGPVDAARTSRLGDVALVPFAPIAFVDPADTGENRLHARHGSLTPDELHVPLLALGGGS